MRATTRLICLVMIYSLLIFTSVQCVENSADAGKWAKDKYEVTAYCPCAICCGHETGITATGYPVQTGTIAVDPKVISFFTVVKIEGFQQLFIAMDTGRDITGKRIDIYYPTHEAAKQFGRKVLKVAIWKQKAEFDPLKGIGEFFGDLFAEKGHKPLSGDPLFCLGNMVGGILR